MLPVFHLDEERYEEILEKAIKMIPTIYPDWTDYNEHDPGITMLQLFSWLKENQQYHMDQIGIQHYLNYLKLLGIHMKRRQPSCGMVEIQTKNKKILPRKSQVMAGEVCFEIQSRCYLEPIQIVKGIAKRGEKEVSFLYNLQHLGGKIRFYMFGTKPQSGDMFYIGLNQSLAGQQVHSIYFDLFEEYGITRNPIKKETLFPLASISLECYTQNGWKQQKIIKDDTFAFLQDGEVSFYLNDKMCQCEKRGNLYLVRIILESASYDVAPVLEGIGLHAFSVFQQETMVEYEDYQYKAKEYTGKFGYYVLEGDTRLALEGKTDFYIEGDSGFIPLQGEIETVIETDKGRILYLFPKSMLEGEKEEMQIRRVSYEKEIESKIFYEGNAFPYQKLELEEEDILYDSIEIMVESSIQKGVFRTWKKVESFDASSPEDEHYQFEEEEGYIQFGDCEKGLAPEGKVHVIGCQRSLGANGNVKKEKIRELRNSDRNELMICNYKDTKDGEDKGNIQDCFLEFKRKSKEITRAVTYEDYENIVRQIPGLMIQNVKAIEATALRKRDGSLEENTIVVAVQPFSLEKRANLSEAYYKNIFRVLDQKRMIGTKIQILSPEYIGLNLFCEVVVKAHYLDAEARIRQTIADYFEKNTWDFGKTVSYSSIYGIIDTLDCVEKINSLTMDAMGKGCRRSMNGDFILPANGLVYLKDAEYKVK